MIPITLSLIKLYSIIYKQTLTNTLSTPSVEKALSQSQDIFFMTGLFII
jgi:hypothetical protein